MTKLNFLFLLVSILHFGHGLTPGQECGTKPNVGLYTYKNGIFGCHTCDADQHWSVTMKRCMACTGSRTNLSPNILTSCKDTRPHENPTMPTLPSSNDTLASKDEQTLSLEENNFHNVSGFPKGIENGTLYHVSMAQNDEQTSGAENTTDEVIGYSKAVESVVVNQALDKDTIDNISMKPPTPTQPTETEEVNISVKNNPRTDDKTTIIVVFLVVVVVLFVIIVVLYVRGRKPSQNVPVASSRDDVEKGANDESQTSLL